MLHEGLLHSLVGGMQTVQHTLSLLLYRFTVFLHSLGGMQAATLPPTFCCPATWPPALIQAVQNHTLSLLLSRCTVFLHSLGGVQAHSHQPSAAPLHGLLH